jgi:hypothetical protein
MHVRYHLLVIIQIYLTCDTAIFAQIGFMLMIGLWIIVRFIVFNLLDTSLG